MHWKDSAFRKILRWKWKSKFRGWSALFWITSPIMIILYKWRLILSRNWIALIDISDFSSTLYFIGCLITIWELKKLNNQRYTAFLSTYMLSLASNSTPSIFYLLPEQNFFNLSVILGPIYCMFTPSNPSWKMYLWCLKNIKSLWLWNVTTLLPLNSGCWGNSEARSLPTLTPTFESKLLRISSGTWSVANPCLFISFWN